MVGDQRQLPQHGPQPEHGQAQARFDGAQGDAELLFDFGVDFVFEEGFADDLGLFRRQRAQRGTNAAFLLRNVEGGIGLQGQIRFLGRVGHQVAGVAFPPQCVDPPVAGDGEDPG